MALIKADRVKETSTSTGTGNFTLNGAVAGYKTFASAVAVNEWTVFFYSIVHSNGIEWETGYGMLVDPTTVQRKWVHASSNLNSLVSFSAGTKEVFVSLTERQVHSGFLPNNGTTASANSSVNMNLYMGYQVAASAYFDTTDHNNILIGNRAFLAANQSNIGEVQGNIAIGANSCRAAASVLDSDGMASFSANVVIGIQTCLQTIGGYGNVVIGANAGTNAANSTQDYCVLIGSSASTSFSDQESVVIGYNSSSIDGKKNTIIGARSASQSTHENCIVIGYDVDSSGSNTTTIGHTTITDCYIRGNLHPSGAVRPASIADASAPTNAIYYSTTAGKLVYKDSSGTVNNLY
jgi:hypothetical protein